MSIPTLDDLARECKYWNKKHRRDSTKGWRKKLGPIYDMYLAPFTSYDAVRDVPQNDLNAGKYGDTEATASLLSRTDSKRTELNDAYGHAFEHIEKVRKLRRLLHTRQRDSLAVPTHYKWSSRIKDVLRSILSEHEAFKYHIASTREDIAVQLVHNIDDVGIEIRPGEGANFIFRVTPNYLSSVYHKGIKAPNNLLILHADLLETQSWDDQHCDLEVFDAVWVESYVARYSAAFHVTVYGKLCRVTLRDDKKTQFYVNGRSVKGIKQKILTLLTEATVSVKSDTEVKE
jgi:hypothetical protein